MPRARKEVNMADPVNSKPGWQSYQQTGNPADIVSSPDVATVFGGKVDAVDGQTQGLRVLGGTLDDTSALGDYLVSRVLGFLGVDGWQEWSPSLMFGAGNSNMSVSYPNAGFTTRANMLWFWVSVRLTFKGSSTGPVTLSGLPHPSVGNFSFPVNVRTTGVATDGSAATAYVTNGLITLFRGASTNDQANVAIDADLENAATIDISGWYPIEGPLI